MEAGVVGCAAGRAWVLIQLLVRVCNARVAVALARVRIIDRDAVSALGSIFSALYLHHQPAWRSLWPT